MPELVQTPTAGVLAAKRRREEQQKAKLMARRAKPAMSKPAYSQPAPKTSGPIPWNTVKPGTNLTGKTVTLPSGQNYPMQSPSSGVKKPTPTSSATPVQPKTSVGTGVSQPGVTSATPSPTTPPSVKSQIGGFDEQALLDSGISQDQISKMKAILSPEIDALGNIAEREGEYTNFVKEDLESEQKDVKAMYDDVKAKKEELAGKQLDVINDTAEVQTKITDQSYQKEKFMNEQAQKQFELDATKAERKREAANEEAEIATRRAVAAQLGADFGSGGLTLITSEKRKGDALLDDLRAQTAIGRSEFSFRAMDIERNYSTELKKISTDKKADSLAVYQTLDEELTGIDEKVLLSAQEKKQAARDAVRSYYDKLNEVEMEAAKKVSDAVNTVYEEKKKLEEEKLTREAVDVDVSAKLGFFANKFGQPIGVKDGEAPKPFAGEFDDKLSKQFGYLVDGRGNAVRGLDGQTMPYTDFEVQKTQNSLAALLSGNYSEVDKSNLNFKLGSNSVIATTLKHGQYYPSKKYGNLQCGEYINDQFLATRELGNDFTNADSLIRQFGGKRDTFSAQVGDVVFMDTGDPTIPHKAIVEGMDEQGNLVLTDANYIGAGVVRHGWKIAKGDANWNKIYGFARLPLKGNVAGAQPMLTPNIGGTDGGSINGGGAKGELVSKKPDPNRNIMGFDFTTYATDPKWQDGVKKSISEMPQFSGPQDITAYIKSKAPNSPITGDMIMASAQKFGVPPELVLAIARHEANFATAGRAARTHNPGNVGNVDSGTNKDWGSWEAGVDALARNISRRSLGGSEQSQPGQAPSGNYQDQVLAKLSANPSLYWDLKDTDREELKSMFGEEAVAQAISGKTKAAEEKLNANVTPEEFANLSKADQDKILNMVEYKKKLKDLTNNGTTSLDLKDKFSMEKDLRAEFLKNTKEYQDTQTAYTKIKNAAQSDSAAGDMAMIFAFMKVLDPGSTVREGEYAQAQQAAGLPTQIVNAYNAAYKGTKLSEEQREDFLKQAKDMYDEQKKKYDSFKKETQNLADQYGLSKNNVIFNLDGEASSSPFSGLLGGLFQGMDFSGMQGGEDFGYSMPDMEEEDSYDYVL